MKDSHNDWTITLEKYIYIYIFNIYWNYEVYGLENKIYEALSIYLQKNTGKKYVMSVPLCVPLWDVGKNQTEAFHW